MRRSSLLLPWLAVVAFAWAQVFGLTRGFVCDCGGGVEITFVDHCHGPHGAECHAEEHEEDPCHDEDDHAGEPGDRHSHEPNEGVAKVGLGMAQVSLPLAPLPEFLPLAELWVEVPQACLPVVASRGEWGRGGPESLRWPQVLKRQIALQV